MAPGWRRGGAGVSRRRAGTREGRALAHTKHAAKHDVSFLAEQAEYNVKFADVKNGFDGRSRGYGIVRFDTEEEAAAAMVLNGYELEGRQILVRYDRQQVRA